VGLRAMVDRTDSSECVTVTGRAYGIMSMKAVAGSEQGPPAAQGTQSTPPVPTKHLLNPDL
jgi:hypothetical protein